MGDSTTALEESRAAVLALEAEVAALRDNLAETDQRANSLASELEATHRELEAVNEALQRSVADSAGIGTAWDGLMRAIPVGAVVVENDDAIRHFNARASEFLIFDSAHNDVHWGHSLRTLDVRFASLDLLAEVARVRETGVALERTAATTNGKVLSVAITPLFSGDEHVQRVVVATLDITALERERERLRVYENLVRDSVSLAAVVDESGFVLDVNVAFQRAVGRSRMSVLGAGFRSLLHADSVAHIDLHLGAGQSENGWTGPLVLRHADGRGVPVRAQLLPSSSGGARQLLGFLANP